MNTEGAICILTVPHVLESQVLITQHSTAQWSFVFAKDMELFVLTVNVCVYNVRDKQKTPPHQNLLKLVDFLPVYFLKCCTF